MRTLLRVAAAVAGLLVLAALAVALSPAPIDPGAYSPPGKPDLAGAFAPNRALQGARLLAKGWIRGPEDIALDDQGRLYAGTTDGRILRVNREGLVQDFAVTGGRPLGLRFDSQGNLIVCDAPKGLL